LVLNGRWVGQACLGFFVCGLGALWAQAGLAESTPTHQRVSNRGIANQNVSRSRELKQQPATTVKEWLAQEEAATVQVTSVSLARSEMGLEITLNTVAGRYQ
jgi:hypothetical protein